MTDVRIYQTNDGGAIDQVGGLIHMDGGLESAVYLSLLGGNELDGNLESTSHLQWWGNLGELEEVKQYRSEFQYLLVSLASVSSNLLRLQEAVGRDLAWLVSVGIAESVDVEVVMTAVNSVRVTVEIIVGEQATVLYFDTQWGLGY